MSAADHLGTYAEGWSKGDAVTILGATAEGYTFDDPASGVIAKEDFPDYLEELKKMVASQCGGQVPDPFMELSEVVTREDDGVVTAWCWFAIPDTQIKGSGLIKVDASGVRSEVITYYAKPAG
jgi:hypothetical protein